MNALRSSTRATKRPSNLRPLEADAPTWFIVTSEATGDYCSYVVEGCASSPEYLDLFSLGQGPNPIQHDVQDGVVVTGHAADGPIRADHQAHWAEQLRSNSAHRSTVAQRSPTSNVAGLAPRRSTHHRPLAVAAASYAAARLLLRVPALQPREKALHGARVQHVGRARPSAPRLIDAVPPREAEVLHAVRVGVDHDRHPGGDRLPDVLVAQVQAVGVRVELEHGASLLRRRDDGVDVDVVGLALQDLPAGRMEQDVGVPVPHGADDPRGHLGAGQVEVGVHGHADDVELGEYVVLDIERAVLVDVHL